MAHFDPDEMRIISLAAPVLLKVLKKKEEEVIRRIVGEFRNGHTEQTANLAELCSIRSISHEITTGLREQDHKGE